VTYTVAWTDYRAHPDLEPGEGDVYTTTVDTAGVVESLVGTEVDIDDVPEGNVALAGADGQAVFVWTKLVNESPYASFRFQVATQADAAAFVAQDVGLGCGQGVPWGGGLALLFPVLLFRRRHGHGT
jgi:hypothetical protein